MIAPVLEGVLELGHLRRLERQPRLPNCPDAFALAEAYLFNLYYFTSWGSGGLPPAEFIFAGRSFETCGRHR